MNGAIPEERTHAGRRVQKVNLFDDAGQYVRQFTWAGTEKAARLAGQLQMIHDTDPRYAPLLAEYQAEISNH